MKNARLNLERLESRNCPSALSGNGGGLWRYGLEGNIGYRDVLEGQSTVFYNGVELAGNAAVTSLINPVAANGQIQGGLTLTKYTAGVGFSQLTLKLSAPASGGLPTVFSYTTGRSMGLWAGFNPSGHVDIVLSPAGTFSVVFTA